VLFVSSVVTKGLAMEEIRRQPEPPERSINGRDLSAATLAENLTTADLPRESPDLEATRYLSAATQLSLGYAEFVVEKVINERFRALAPTFGVDVPVVAKWAIKALRTRANRDYVLSFMLILFALLSILTFQWMLVVILAPTMLLASWLVVSWEYWERIHHTVIGRMLRGRFDPTQAPVPRQGTHRQRLEEVEKRRDGNLVVFSGHSAFVGSGQRLYFQKILLDVSRGTEQKDGTLKEPKPFDSQDVHTAIVEAFDCKVGLGKRLENLKVYERLFVNGLNIQGSKLFRRKDSLRSPPTSVDKVFLADAAKHPTPEARTYVCVEMTGWKGQLVVTLFVRVVHTGDSLYIEWTFRVLPPLRRQFLVIDEFYQGSKRLQVRNSLRCGLQEAIPALLGSPFKALSAYRRPYVARRLELWQADIIKRGYVFDYGAQKSIREEACGRQRQHYFLARDESMYVLLAQQKLTQAIGYFLDEHDVALADFHAQAKNIFNQTLNITNVGDIKDSTGVVIGSNSKANVGDSPRGKK
jgi:hypothetical protein